MKKKLICISFIFSLFCSSVFSQMNYSIEIFNDVYNILESAVLKGYCKPLSGLKPYSVNSILKAVDEILENEITPKEYDILTNFKEKYENSEKGLDLSKLSHKITTDEDSPFYASYQFNFSLSSNASGGLYTEKDFDQWSYEISPAINFKGDISEYFSYAISGKFFLTSAPLCHMGDDYFVGYPWFDSDIEYFYDGEYKKNEDGTYILDSDENKIPYDISGKARYIKKFLNTSYLPYQYRKNWEGQMYFLSALNASGLEGWPTENGISGSILAELSYSAFDNRVYLKAGRYRRELAGMDNGSSLVLNQNAQPFMGFDMNFNVFPFLKYSAISGILEYPNADYLYTDSYYPETSNGTNDDSYFYQNAFAVNMIEVDFPYFHFDFGSSVVFPKRFEIGYLFPLINYVEYQNHIGDCDNLSLFGDIKVQKPGLGSIWASLYLDEINGFNNDPFTSTRAMYAGQLGTKIDLPFLPFASISLRYTKVEPYCYTHHSINYSPWYDHYIMENYSNNGYCLGYYLPPNSDEMFVQFDSALSKNINARLTYQFVRHGADYGSQQVPGSSLYSELSKYNRDELEKYFLHDGAYNWQHIVSIGSTFTFEKAKLPCQFFVNAGFLYSYYTMIDNDNYDRSVYGNNGNCKNADKTTPYYFVNTDEYPVQCGCVLSVGINLFYW